jgi:hypothetical protein
MYEDFLGAAIAVTIQYHEVPWLKTNRLAKYSLAASALVTASVRAAGWASVSRRNNFPPVFTSFLNSCFFQFPLLQIYSCFYSVGVDLGLF